MAGCRPARPMALPEVQSGTWEGLTMGFVSFHISGDPVSLARGVDGRVRITPKLGFMGLGRLAAIGGVTSMVGPVELVIRTK